MVEWRRLDGILGTEEASLRAFSVHLASIKRFHALSIANCLMLGKDFSLFDTQDEAELVLAKQQQNSKRVQILSVL